MSAAPICPPQQGRLTFEPVTHTYRLDNQAVPGVTSILKAAGIVDYSPIAQDVLQRAARRGTAVHTALQYFDEGTLDLSSVDPDHLGYLEAYERFLMESRFVPAHIEHRVFHEGYRYAGTLDRTGMIDGSLVILDFKTGLVLPGHALQLAAYANCLVMPRRFRRIALQLNGNGTYRVHEYAIGDFQRDLNIFLSALACFQFRARQTGAPV